MSRLAEFMVWTAVALLTAIMLVMVSETFLPSNF